MRTRAGYAGGTTPAPTYRQMGDHTEVLQVDFDPAVLSYADLLARVWRDHSPTRRVPSVQYRNVILVHGAAQRAVAEAQRAALEARLGARVETPIEDVGVFTRAEGYHQKYTLRRFPQLVEALGRFYPDEVGFTDSTAAARLNGYLAGYGSVEAFERDLPLLGLDPAACELARARALAVLG